MLIALGNREINMNYTECICENVITNGGVNGMRGLVEMMANFDSDMGNMGIVYFPITIVLNPYFHNYMRKLSHQLLISI